MTTQEIMQASRLEGVRALKAENARLRAELAAVREAQALLESHVALALEAARDLDRLGADGALVVVDGWNAVLGATGLRTAGHASCAARREHLLACVRARLARHPRERAWVVFDGEAPNGRCEERLRVSWTGGTGAHRADRLVCDYLRMCRFDGRAARVTVVSDDRAFRREAVRLGAAVLSVRDAFSGDET